MKAFIVGALGLLFACCAFVTCEAASVSDLRAAIEGVYILDEWHSEGKIFRPPQVEGRVVYENGVVLVILIDNIQDSKKIYNASFGVYSFGPDSFAYKLDNRSLFTQTPDNITVSHALPWEGMREFAANQAGNSVHLRYGDKVEFTFAPDGLTYSEGGEVLRVYHRAKSD